MPGQRTEVHEKADFYFEENAMKRTRYGLYKRGTLFCFRYKTPAGEWKEKRTGLRDFAKARTFKREFENLLATGSLPTERAAWTVEQAATRWVEQHAARLTSEKARRNERSYLRQLVRRLGTRKLKSITLDVLKEYQRTRRLEVRERPINLELQILVSVLKEANLWLPIAEHYRRLKEPKSEVGRALTSEQLQHLQKIAASRDDWMVAYSAAIITSNCGMRGGEVKALRMGAIDLEERRLSITRGKSEAARRMVELNAAATAAITALYMRAQSLGARDADDYLLPADLSRHTKTTDPLKGQLGYDASRHQMSWDTAWRNLRRAAANAITERAGKEGRELTDEERASVKIFQTLRFHTLRHTFVTWMAEGGVPLPVLMSMVGHVSAEMSRHYTHISNTAARKAVELLDEKNPATPSFVADVVAEAEQAETTAHKLLN
jgi:integrase